MKIKSNNTHSFSGYAKHFPEDSSVLVNRDGLICVTDESRIFATNRDRYLLVRIPTHSWVLRLVGRLFKLCFRITGFTLKMEKVVISGDRSIFIPFSYIYARTFVDKPEHLLHQSYEKLKVEYDYVNDQYRWTEI